MVDREALEAVEGALVDAVAVALVVLDADMRIIRVNDAFCAWTGFSALELLGRAPPYPFWPDHEDPAGLARWMLDVSQGARASLDITLCHRDGRLMDGMMTGNQLAHAGGAIANYMVTFWDFSEARSQERLERALGDVARVAAGVRDEPRVVFDRVATRLAEFLRTPSAAVVRFEEDRGVVVGAHALPTVPLPGELPFSEPSAAALVARSGHPEREDYTTAESGFAARARAAGLLGAVAVPVEVDNALWGCLSVAFDRAVSPALDLERPLGRFAGLVSMALANAEAWSRLQLRATTDGLTGLLNDRSFYERLEAEHRRSARYSRPLALALFDVDGLKALNDTHGHQTGDRALRTVARAFVEQARAGDVAARLGGDEFAVIAPDTDAVAALVLADRLRAAASDALAQCGLAVSVSCGISDLSLADEVDELVRLADGALYYAKHEGGNQAARYTPGVIEELSYGQALSGSVISAAEAMSRAVVSKNGSAREHAERVARVAEHAAARLGWDRQRRVRLREAALLHDIGNLAVPQALLTKPGRFTSVEYEQVKPHAVHGAHIAEGLLDAEQFTWIRWHHERPDGRGYPDGLAHDAIPDGARVLAVADAYDAITRSVGRGTPRTPTQAIAELRRCIDSQFDPAVVCAVAAWVAASRTRAGQPPPEQ